MSTTFENPVENMVVNVSDENKAFYKYLLYVTKTQKEIQDLKSQRDAAKDPKEKEKIAAQILEKQEAGLRFKAQYLEENKDLFAAKVLRTSDDVNVPEFKDEEGNMDDKKRFAYYHDHFWDNVDLMDDRLLYTPVLNQKISTYIEKLTPQIPDSICAAINFLTNKTTDTSLIYKYIIQYSTNTYEKSDIMGMDAVFVCIAEDYYSQGKAFWLDEEKNQEIVDMYNTRKNLIVGIKAENIILPDVEGNWHSLYDVKAKYTYLVFWDPNCGHCKKEMPKLKELYATWKDKGLEVYAVSTEFDNKDWPKFIKDNGFEWIDVSDTPEINKNALKYIQEGKTTLNSLNFRDYWDLYSTPQFYILDENKVIIGKKIGAEQFPDFIESYESRHQESTL
jgi:thiol-disulfide isomerase/thioredoxin